MPAKNKIQIASNALARTNGPRRATVGAGTAVDFIDMLLSLECRPDDEFAMRLRFQCGEDRDPPPTC